MVEYTVQFILKQNYDKTFYITLSVITKSLFHLIPVISIKIIFLKTFSNIRRFVNTLISQNVRQLLITRRITTRCNGNHHFGYLTDIHTILQQFRTFLSVSCRFEELIMSVNNGRFQFKRYPTFRSIYGRHICSKNLPFLLDIQQPVVFIIRFLVLAIYKKTLYRLLTAFNTILDTKRIAIKYYSFNPIYIYIRSKSLHFSSCIIPKYVTMFCKEIF